MTIYYNLLCLNQSIGSKWTNWRAKIFMRSYVANQNLKESDS